MIHVDCILLQGPFEVAWPLCLYLELWVERLQDVDLVFLISKPDFRCSFFQHLSTLCGCIVCAHCGYFSSHDWKMWANYGGISPENISDAPAWGGHLAWEFLHVRHDLNQFSFLGSLWSRWLLIGRKIVNTSCCRSLGVRIPACSPRLKSILFSGVSMNSLALDRQENSEYKLLECTKTSVAHPCSNRARWRLVCESFAIVPVPNVTCRFDNDKWHGIPRLADRYSAKRELRDHCSYS